MNRDEVTSIAGEELTKHNLLDWRFVIDERLRRTAGRCHFRTKIIEMSAWLIDLNDPPEVLDTLRHEIAHALAGRDAGHGPDWVRMCDVTGCRPERCYTREQVNVPDGRYHSQCVHCQREVNRMALKPGARYACPCTAGFSPRPILAWTHSAMLSEIRAAARATHFDTVDTERTILLHELGQSKCGTRKKAIRSRLRKLGHRGGLQ